MEDEPRSRGELTRDRILKAAHALFVRQGYHGTSMRQIAASAEIALSGLYNHFTSKEEVFHAVFIAYHPYREVIPVLIKLKNEDIESFVRDALRKILKIINERPDFLNLMLIEHVEFNSIHTAEISALWLPQVMPVAEALLKKNRERLRPIPSMMLVRTFWGLLFAYYLTEKVLPLDALPQSRENSADYFTDIYLRGILNTVS